MFAAAVPALFIAGAVYLYVFGSPFFCMFYQLTGLYCPGCGTGRAASALIHFHFLEAFLYNPLVMLAAPFIAYYFAAAYLRTVAGKIILPLPKLSFKVYYIVIGVFIIFGVLRNIPALDFLAP